MMFIIGVGSRSRGDAANIFVERQVGRAISPAALAARDTPRMALAFRRLLFGVPSSSIIRVIDPALVLGVEAGERTSKISPLTASTAFLDALAAIAGLVAVTKLDSLVGAGRRTRGYGRAAEGAVVQGDIDFDRRIAAAVQNLAGDDIDDLSHGFPRAVNGGGVSPGGRHGEARAAREVR